MSPEAVRAFTDTYGSPGSGGSLASIAIRTSPLTEWRSSHAGKWSATPTVMAPEADRRSSEPLVDGTAMSPEPELARSSTRCTARTVTSPEPDFATKGQYASLIWTSPEPLETWAASPRTAPTDTSPLP